MAGFDDYLKKHEKRDDQALFITEEKKDAFISAQKNQGLPGGTYIEDTADMLAEKYESRISDETTFKQRTEYYFENADLLRAKAERYRNLAKSENDDVNNYAGTYKNRKAGKRKGYAKDAAKSFDKAAKLEEKIPKDLTGIRLYKEREKVIRTRMEGMEYAAKVKSQSSADETYRRVKSRYSCLMILKDQLDHIRLGASQEELTKIEKEAVKLDKEIKKVKSDLGKYAPDVQKNWEIRQKFSNDDLAGKCKKTVGALEDKQARTLLYQESRLYVGFSKSVRRDEKGNPMSREDKENAEWNQKMGQAYLDGNKEVFHQMMAETFERLGSVKLPVPAEIEKKELLPALYKNPLQYADMFRFIENIDRLTELDAFTATYLAQHPEFKKKISIFKDLHEIYKKQIERNEPTEEMKKNYKDHFDQEVKPVDEAEVKAVPFLNAGHKYHWAYNHKDYNSILKKHSNKYLKMGANGDTVDRTYLFVMKPVSFDGGGAPITEKDKKNHEWNMKFFEATREGHENLPVIADYVEYSLEHTYDDVEMPPEPVGDMTEEEKKKFRKQMDDWCERQIHSDDFEKRMFNMNKPLAVDNFKKQFPGVREFFQNNPKYEHKENVITNAYMYLQNHLLQRYRVDLEKNTFVPPLLDNEIEANNFLVSAVTDNLIESYQQYKEQKDKITKPYDKSKIQELEPKLAEAEFKRLKEVQPELTEE